MTKMAIIPIYGKNPNYFVQVSDRCPWATCLKVLLTAMMPDKIKSDLLLQYESSFLEDGNMNNRNSAFARNLHTNFVLLRLRYYQQHAIEFFSNYESLILDSD